ncbi:Ig-like domain-containing protein, partial [Staphylococcus caeli]
MKNRQGFLPNRLNKYSIRKFTVGTASLLVGATLVFGVGSEVQAAELDSITDNNAKDNKGEALDISDIKAADENTSSEDVVQSSEENETTTSNESNNLDTENSASEDTSETSVEKTNEDSTTETPTTEAPIKEQTSTEETPTKDNSTETQTDKSDSNTTKEQSPDTTTETPSKEQSTSENVTTDNKTKQQSKDDTTATETPKQEQATNKKQTKKTTATADKKKTSKQTTTTVKKAKQSALETKLSSSKNKEATVESFLNSQVSDAEAQKIMDNADINYDTATAEEINVEILKASLITLVNSQKSAETLATPTRTMFRAMATPTALAAAVDQSEEVEKSLGYLDNYTFATLMFNPKPLDSDTILKGNYIPFDINSYMSGANSGDRYKIDLKLDPLIADHVTKITANPAGRSTPVEFTRLRDENGNLTDIWEINFIRANGGLFGGAEILSQYKATNGRIELDDTVENILKAAGDLSNNKLNYQMYVRDSEGNKIVRTSESSGYFLTKTDADLIQLQNNVSSDSKTAFQASTGSATFDPTIGTNGGFIVDQQIMKDGIFTYTRGKGWSYNFQIDKDLLPYIDTAELHSLDYKGLSGFDKTYIAGNKVATLTLDANGNGTITSSNLNDLIEFNNLTPETVGIRIVLKLNQSANNILTQDAQYDAQGNLIGETVRQKEDFTFAGYLTDSTGKLINNTMGTATLALQDYDRDGLLDRYERQVSFSDPENNDTDGDGKNDGDEVVKYKTSPLVGTPVAADVTTDDVVVTGTVPLKTGAATQTAKVINASGVTVGSATVNADGTFSVSIPKSPAGTYTIAIDSPNYDNDEVSKFNIIDVSKVPAPTINPVDDNDKQLTVNGTAGATITVKDSNNNVIGTVTIPANGAAATINLSQPLKAGTVLNSTASLNGKVSDVSNTVTVTDATAPDAPTINTVNSESTQISGTAEAGSTVTVTIPGNGTVTGVADAQGNYTIAIPDQVDLKGGETLTATATDKAGNVSENASTTVTDTTAPEAPTVNDVTSDDTQISGTAEPGSTVTVTFPDGTTATGTADDEGNYTIDIPTNVDLKGDEDIVVTSTDKDGNVSDEATTTVTDTTAPEAPTVNDVTSDDTTISGTA